MSSIQSIRGMRDLFDDTGRRWAHLETSIRAHIAEYGFGEIQLPLLESTDLFSRGVGEATDIVEKEMYSLEDREGNSITLRPEGTASCVRAMQQHGHLYNQVQKVCYSGPMFRYERPQKGRYRQFFQVGAEVFGFPGPDADVELMEMCARLWEKLGLDDLITLQLNTLGSGAARAQYVQALRDYLTPLEAELDADSQRRLAKNPLRILDSKNQDTQALLAGAPSLTDFLDDTSRAHFDTILAMLEELSIPYEVNTRLVRGLDYYTHTVFEWVTDALGAQGAVCAGGRYDGLVERLGGKPTPAAGFAIGLDRVLLLHELIDADGFREKADIYICVLAAGDFPVALSLATQLRAQSKVGISNLKVVTHNGGGKLKNQLKKADASGAKIALILGESEIQDATVTIKMLRQSADQMCVQQTELPAKITQLMSV